MARHFTPHRPSRWWVAVPVQVGLGIGLAFCTVGHAHAAPTAADPPPAQSAEAEDNEQAMLEQARVQARRWSEWVARNVDSWFGNTPFEDGGQVTQGRVSLGVFHRRDQGSDVDLRFTARFRLPNIEKSAYLFVGREDPRLVVKDTPSTLNSKQQLLESRPEERSFLGGLGLSFSDDVNFRAGVSAHLQPFVQARYDQSWALGPGQLLAFRETLFWSRQDRLGSTTALSYNHALQPQLQLRSSVAATITQETRNVEWSAIVGVYRSFGPQEVLSMELLFNGTGTQGTGVGLSDRGVLARWQQPVYKDWLIGELTVGHFWPRPDQFSPRGQAWAAGASVKMYF